MTNKFLTIGEVAKMVGVSIGTIRRWAQRGVLRSFRAYNRAHRRFSPQEIEVLLKSRN
jgi:excisionase family DNA binding protein